MRRGKDEGVSIFNNSGKDKVKTIDEFETKK